MDKKKTKSRILDNKIFWAVVSLFISVLLWVYVTTSVERVFTQTFQGVNVVFKGEEALLAQEQLALFNISNEKVDVLVSGTSRELNKLSSDTITAEVALTNISTSGHYSRVVTIRWPSSVSSNVVKVISTSPSSISFDVDKTVTKAVEIRGKFIGSVAEGFTQKPMQFEPQTITITGPSDRVYKIDHAWVEVDRKDVDKTIQAEYPYQLLDMDGEIIVKDGLELSQETISVTVPINLTKEVPLTIDRIYDSSTNAENVEVSIEPKTITIAGDADTLEGINHISVGTIDLASFALSYEDKHQIILPNDVTNVSGIMEAKVTIKVIGLETRELEVTNITHKNGPTGRTPTVVTEGMKVILRGKANVLKEIEPNNIRVVADLSGFGAEPGLIEPKAKVEIDGFQGVGAIGPYSVSVRIT